ncbi:MAG TPA: hypothetical protein QF468_12165 [Nitrospinota bacterium]|nr:hypothetical protein [Nitrospinota bacterium]
MTVEKYWVLFPILFFLVLGCLITAVIRTFRQNEKGIEKWTVVPALVLIIVTAFSGRFFPHNHRIISFVAEGLIFFNAIIFWKKKERFTSCLNISALFFIFCDFSLHKILK